MSHKHLISLLESLSFVFKLLHSTLLPFDFAAQFLVLILSVFDAFPQLKLIFPGLFSIFFQLVDFLPEFFVLRLNSLQLESFDITLRQIFLGDLNGAGMNFIPQIIKQNKILGTIVILQPLPGSFGNKIEDSSRVVVNLKICIQRAEGHACRVDGKWFKFLNNKLDIPAIVTFEDSDDKKIMLDNNLVFRPMLVFP